MQILDLPLPLSKPKSFHPDWSLYTALSAKDAFSVIPNEDGHCATPHEHHLTKKLL